MLKIRGLPRVCFLKNSLFYSKNSSNKKNTPCYLPLKGLRQHPFTLNAKCLFNYIAHTAFSAINW